MDEDFGQIEQRRSPSEVDDLPPPQHQNPLFRSVLPHEPPLVDVADDENGYLYIQGTFTPKVGGSTTNKQQSPSCEQSIHEDNDSADGVSLFSDGEIWIREKRTLEEILLAGFVAASASSTSASPAAPNQLKILDPHLPFTKIRLTFDSPTAAHESMLLYRKRKLTPAQLYDNVQLSDFDDLNEPQSVTNCSSSSTSELQPRLIATINACKDAGLTSHRALQIMQITTHPLPQPCWTRSSPPKFRRLMARPGEDIEALERERQTTRFVVFSNLLSEKGENTEWQANPKAIAEAIRSIVEPFNASGVGVEVFVPNQPTTRVRYCHVGMRSAEDARAVVLGLQGKIVEWPWLGASTTADAAPQNNKNVHLSPRTIQSGKLFVDYAAITQRSEARAVIRDSGGLIEKEKRETTRPLCTSTTDHVHIEGLVLVPDFVSEEEESVLMAVLTGPQAPWAPSQTTASHGTAPVRRKVQHYGYIFDYQTADVLRDRTQEGADCPPMPALPESIKESMSTCDSGGGKNKIHDLLIGFSQDCVNDGRGWDVLAALTERTRHHQFDCDTKGNESSPLLQSFPYLNQLTVNYYHPGEGIGSHIDTPSAFDDGLISISLNSGIVMEFRKEGNKNIRKFVYLPPRSLLLMSREARYTWEHAIVTRMTDTHHGEVLARQLRVSLTFRTARSADGASPLPLVESAEYPPVWGKRLSKLRSLATPDCERDHVHAVYDAIATQWHHTRGKRGVLWPGATQFLQKLPQGSVVADVGCGDGKYFPAIWEAGSYVIGTDISEPLLRTAICDNSIDTEQITENRRVSDHRLHLRNRPAVVIADCMSIPFQSSSCDAAICIAVLHHISTRERRIRCIEELVRIVKPGGLVNVQAWAMEQEVGSRRKFAAKDVFVPFNVQPKYLQLNQTDCDRNEHENEPSDNEAGKSTAQLYSEAFKNAEYDDKKGLVVFQRYCHLYRQGELDEIANEVPGVHIEDSGFESGNYFIVFKVDKSEEGESS